MSNETKCFYEFGPFRLDGRTCLLWNHDELIMLEPKIARTLLVLVRAKGALVEKENLIKEVWEGVAVTEHSMTRNISILRKTLKKGLPGKDCIETVPTLGYRFTLPVTERAEELDKKRVQPIIQESGMVFDSGDDGPKFSNASVAPLYMNRSRFVLALLVGLVAVSVLGVAVAYYNSNGHSKATLRTSALPVSRPIVAVLGFRNLSPNSEDEWLSTAFSEWLISELTIGGKFQVISGEDVAGMKRDLGWGKDIGNSPEKIAAIARNLKAEFVIDGSYAVTKRGAENQVRIDIHVRDASGIKTIASLGNIGEKARLFEFVADMGSELREKLGLFKLSSSDMSVLRASMPATQKAARLYSDGLEKLRHYDFLAGEKDLSAAIDADPNYPLSHFALSTAWSTLGYENKALQEAKQAMELSAGLSREECLAIEANYREIDKDWPKAIHIYEALWLFATDNIDYGLRLARVQTQAGKGQDAIETLHKLRDSHSPRSNDPRIDYLEAKALESMSDFTHELTAVDQAIKKGREQNATRLVAQALSARSWALDNLGRAQEAADAGAEAQRTFASIGDRAGEAMALKNLGDALIDLGKPEESLERYRQGIQIFREVGNGTGTAVLLNNMALVLKAKGDLTQAKEAFGESATICRSIGDTNREALALDGIGAVLWREGNPKAALATYEKSLAIFKQIGDKGHAANVMSNMALALQDQGHLAAARMKMEEALAVFREIEADAEIARMLENIGDLLLIQGDLSGAKLKFEEALKISQHRDYKSHQGYALDGIAQVSLARGDLSDAEKQNDAALKVRTSIGEKGTIAETQLNLSQLRIEQGRYSDAEQLARQAVDQFKTEGEIDDQGSAFAMLAKALLAQGKKETAEKAIDSALMIAKKTDNRGVRFFISTTAAQLWAENGNMAKALSELNSIIAECRKYRYGAAELEARLALGELKIRAGKTSDAMMNLSALERDATSRGFLLIASKAAMARKEGHITSALRQ